MTKEQEEFMIKNEKLNELCQETQGYGRMQFIDRIAYLELDRDKLIKYLEDKINNMDIENETEYGHARDIGMNFAYQDILERVKSGKYE